MRYKPGMAWAAILNPIVSGILAGYAVPRTGFRHPGFRAWLDGRIPDNTKANRGSVKRLALLVAGFGGRGEYGAEERT